jgi:hypothetical protein
MLKFGCDCSSVVVGIVVVEVAIADDCLELLCLHYVARRLLFSFFLFQVALTVR